METGSWKSAIVTYIFENNAKELTRAIGFIN